MGLGFRVGSMFLLRPTLLRDGPNSIQQRPFFFGERLMAWQFSQGYVPFHSIPFMKFEPRNDSLASCRTQRSHTQEALGQKVLEPPSMTRYGHETPGRCCLNLFPESKPSALLANSIPTGTLNPKLLHP